MRSQFWIFEAISIALTTCFALMARFITTPHVCVSVFVICTNEKNKIRLSYLGAVCPFAFVLSAVHIRTFACCDDLLQTGCWPRRSASPPLREEIQKPVGALINILGDQPCLMSTGEDSSSQMSKTSKSCYGLTLTAKKTISPRKRSRTARVEHIQRPCLDFEKMQQLQTHAVSWRHGGELSLFCW